MFRQQTASKALKLLNLAAIGIAVISAFTDEKATLTSTTLTIAASLTQVFASSTLTTSIAGFTNPVSALCLMNQPASIFRTFNFALQLTNTAADTLFGANEKFKPPVGEIVNTPSERQSLLTRRR